MFIMRLIEHLSVKDKTKIQIKQNLEKITLII